MNRLHDVVAYWAARKPSAPAIINATRGTTLDWASLHRQSAAVAAQLPAMGFRRGDFLAASLPFSTGHIVLEYACFRAGVIHVPLDLRLPPAEVARCLAMIGAGSVFPGAMLEEMIQREAGAPPPDDGIGDDGAQVIFTTGSTGAPKPALLSHRGILCQNRCLGAGFQFREGLRVLVNLPPSHVGGQAELLMTTLYHGGVAVVLESFDAAKSLEAIKRYRVQLIGQIPAMFHLEWRLSGYSSYDLSSLESAIYGGQQVGGEFLNKLASMAPKIGTGLGLTEASGFCTYTHGGEIASSIGRAMPDYPLTIRAAMRDDGSAGEELPQGETGHVCFQGPQTFLGYVNDAEATARTISKEGYLYTGDMGHVDEAGLHFAGRAKWILKPAGYQVFPGDVENHFAAMPGKVAGVGVVGVEHNLWSEGIVAFVERQPGAELTVEELKKHARSLASYMRPLHYVVLEPGQMPLNRTAKVDTLRLQQLARDEVARLRERGRWDG